jgi:hypothetical protein
MKAKSVVSIMLLIGLAVGAGVVARRKLGTVANAKSTFAFTLHSHVTRINPKDSSEIVSQEVRYVSSSGNFRAVHTEANGVVRESFFERGRGFFYR